MRDRKRRELIWGGLVILTALVPARAESPLPRPAAPTYHKDVAPILQKHCQDCHRPGQVAPFAMLTFEQARKRAADLAHVTGERIMPPWPASTTYGGPFADQRVLSDAEIATLRTWADADTPEGNPSDAPPPREFVSDDWPLGKPDLVLTNSEPYQLSASGDDEFRVFVLPTRFEKDRWIRAVDYRPGNRKVVHHVIGGIDSSGSARKKDKADPLPGYSSVGGFGDGVPLRGFLPIWTPGSRPRYAPKDAGYVLPAGTDVLIQVHYHKSGKPETDLTEIGLYLSDSPLPKRVETGFVFPDITQNQMVAAVQKLKDPNRRPELEDFMRDILVIPAGEARYVVKASTKKTAMGRPLPRDILLTSVMPHMHWLGKGLHVLGLWLPDEAKTRIPLIKIDHWNFNWQGTYALAEPVRLPKGAWLEMEAHFDNSADNPLNPSKPPKLVHWGNQTSDEMCIGIFEFVRADGESSKPEQPAKPPSDSR